MLTDEQPRPPAALQRFKRLPSGILVPETSPSGSSEAAPSGTEVFVDHGAVFPEEQDGFLEFKRLVRQLSRTDAIFWCARLNILVSDSTKDDSKDTQGYCIGVFFAQNEIELINAFAKAHGGRDHCTVFFRGQLLELMRWIVLLSVDQPGDGKTFDSPDARRAFARAALLASDVWQRRVYGDRMSRDETIEQTRRTALASVRLSSIESAPCPHPFFALARGVSLFADRMTTLAPDVADRFRATAGLSIEDYFSILAYIACEGLGRPVEGLRDPKKCGLFDANVYERADPPLGPIAREFLAREAQTVDELRHALWGGRTDAVEEDARVFDLKPLRNRPIFRANDGRAVILDPRSFVERASAGPLFQLVTADPTHQQRWFALFGDLFEAYCQDLFRRMYPETPVLVRRFTPNPSALNQQQERIELGDGLLLADMRAALIEMKAVWIPDLVISPEVDEKKYLEEIRKRYGVSESVAPGERRVKGIGQLARSISRIADETWTPTDVDFGPLSRIVPVLLVHDAHLDAPLHSHVLAQEFAALLGNNNPTTNWTEMRCGSKWVAHLVVLTTEDLELLETSSRHFSVMECLQEYARACPDRLMSFHNFLASSRFRQHLRGNAWLASRYVEVLDRSMERLFPGSKPEPGGVARPRPRPRGRAPRTGTTRHAPPRGD